MTEYRIFLGSSISDPPLEYDRNAIGNLIRRMNDAFRASGRNTYLKIFLCEWEDATMKNQRTQDTYNDFIRNCDLFVGLFFRKRGIFTLEELEVARETGRPVCLFMRTAQEDGTPVALSSEDDLQGISYTNMDELLLHLLRHLQAGPFSDAITFSGGNVLVDGSPVLLNVPERPLS